MDVKSDNLDIIYEEFPRTFSVQHCKKEASQDSFPSLYTEEAAITTNELRFLEKSGSYIIRIPLPSLGTTVFSVSQSISVEQFSRMLKSEDASVKDVRFFDYEGDQLASSTLLGHMMPHGMQLVLNSECSIIKPVESNLALSPEASEIRALLEDLKSALPTQETRQQEILWLENQLNGAESDLELLRAKHDEINARVATSRSIRTFIALAAMATQWGFLAQLTFVEFSWDLMEPITYFITYGTQIAFLAYFIATNKEYKYDNWAGRHYSKKFLQLAHEENLDVKQLERLSSFVHSAEQRISTLKRLSPGCRSLAS